LQGGVLGLLGSAGGSALAVVLVHLFTTLAPAFPFPIAVTFPIVIGAAVLATLTGVLSAAVPALRAARLDPVEAIRGWRAAAGGECALVLCGGHPGGDCGVARGESEPGPFGVRGSERAERLRQEYLAEPDRTARPPGERPDRSAGAGYRQAG